MHNSRFFLIVIIYALFMFSCGGKDDETEPSPEVNEAKAKIEKGKVDDSTFSENSNVTRNIPEIVEDLRRDIKNLKAELEYQHENLSKLEAQTQVWANPFAIYNKEIVLNNGSSIFGKIVYQDQDVMKVETLIGQLIIDRNTIIRVVNQINAYSNLDNASLYPIANSVLKNIFFVGCSPTYSDEMLKYIESVLKIFIRS